MEIPSEVPSVEARNGRPGDHTAFISLAFLAGLVFGPLVVAVGLLTDRGTESRIPPEIAAAPFRGTLGATAQFAAPAPGLALSPRRATN